MIRLMTASRCCMNRRRIICHWLRASTVNSRSGPALVDAGAGGCWPLSPAPCSRRISVGDWTSGIANPWVDDTVEEVGDQVEHDHDDGGDHQPRQHDVDVDVVYALNEVVTHSLPAEDGLGDDGATEHGCEVDRYHRDNGDEGVAQGVLDQHLAARHTLRPRQPDVV